MPYSALQSFLSSDETNTASRWAGNSIEETVNEMKKLQHNWTADVLGTTIIEKTKAKNALDQAFIAGNQSDDNEFQDIMRVLPFSYLLDITSLSLNNNTISTDTTLSGFNAYKNLTIDDNTTVTLDGNPSLLLVSKTLTIKSTGLLVQAANGASGASGGSDGGDGGQGGGGAYVLAGNFVNNNEFHLNGENGLDGNPSSAADGNNGSSGLEITVNENIHFASGNSGGGDYGGAGNINGGGGGSEPSSTYTGGDGGSSSTVNYSSTEIIKHIRKVLIDQWLQNTESRSPSALTASKSIEGDGGGEGCGYGNDSGGGGGGGGGQLLLRCINFDNNIITVSGGAGGAGDDTGFNGGAGGGGSLIIAYENLANQGTLTAGGSTLIDTS